MKFTFSGQFLPLTGSNSRELYPEIQVWRLSQNESDPQSSGDTYVKLASIGNQTAPRFSGYINVYEYVLETPWPVEEGDVLGYYQPPSSASLMGLVAVNDERTDNYYLFGQNPDVFTLSSKFVGKSTRTPLISFEYCEFCITHSLTFALHYLNATFLEHSLLHWWNANPDVEKNILPWLKVVCVSLLNLG